MTCVSAAAAFAQGTFRNLEFEESLINPGTAPGKVSRTLAIPGWMPFLDETPLSVIFYNQGEIFRSDIMLYDRSSGLNVIDGQYTLLLTSIGTGDSSIRQTGIVPSDAPFLLFKLGPRQVPIPQNTSVQPTIRMNGEIINYHPVEFAAGYALFSADVSRFGGQSVTLEFAAVRPPQGVSIFPLDSIEFSAVPEPCVFSLLGLGLILLSKFRLRSR